MPLNNHHAADGTAAELAPVSATREMPVDAAAIFDLLSNPERHHETDSSGSVLSVDKGQRLTGVGDTFRMNMTNANGDDYQTDNEVVAFADGRVIGWRNNRNATNGVQVRSIWRYELEPVDATTTRVTLTYDPSEIDDPEVATVARQFDQAVLEKSLAGLADALA